MKENNKKACNAIGDTDDYSIKHTWIQYHQLTIGINTLNTIIKTLDIDFQYIFKTRYDCKYPVDFYPHTPVNDNMLDLISFNKHNKDKILKSMNEYNLKDIDDLILFNEKTRLTTGHTPIEHFSLSFGGRVCYNYKSLQNIKKSKDNILYSFNDYYFFSNKETFMKLSNIYIDSGMYSNENPDLLNHIFCPESQLMVYCLNNNIDILMYSECFYDTMVNR